MDGRSLYTPLFSGVFWERQDTLLEDIDRIEVIRGPGGALWGANAVNGVINIITKSAWETQGPLAVAKIGEESSVVSLRYGSHNENTAYRVYLQARELDSFSRVHDGEAHDDWRMLQGGFRLDHNLSQNRTLRLSGDIYTQTAGVMQGIFLPSPPYEVFIPDDGYGFGANIFLKISEQKEDGGWHLQSYYDASSASGYPLLNWKLKIYDIEFQQHFIREHLTWTWGFGYRLYDTEVKRSAAYAFVPPNTKTYIWNAFGQAEINLSPDFRLILGSKFEYHEDTGFNFQPTARFLWKLGSERVLWGAVSRAVRTPSRGELDAIINLYIPQVKDLPLPLFFELNGNDDLDPEELIAFELGYRHNPSPKFQYDIALFLNLYDDLISLPAPQAPPEFHPLPWPHFHAYTQAKNLMDGETYGFEIAAFYRPTNNLFFQLSYSYLKIFLHTPQETIWFGEEQEKEWPRHILSWRGCYQFFPRWHLDIRIRYVSEISHYQIPSYWATDFKITWQPQNYITLSIGGENIFDPKHPEFGQAYALRTPLREAERNFFIKLKWNL